MEELSRGSKEPDLLEKDAGNNGEKNLESDRHEEIFPGKVM